jgi:peptide/nickel transport system permease protein
MSKYFITRFFLFVPTLIIISLFAFLISLLAPGDPVEWSIQNQTGAGNKMLSELRLEQKKIWHRKKGLDLPVFYFSLQSLAEPDTLCRIYPDQERKNLLRILSRYGNWDLISRYYTNIKELEFKIAHFEITPGTSFNSAILSQRINEMKFDCLLLYSLYDPVLMNARLEKLDAAVKSDPVLEPLKKPVSEALLSFSRLTDHPSTWKNYIPVIHFHQQNQYHRWIFGDGKWLTGQGAVYSRGIIRGDFGTSYTTGLPVMKQLITPVRWSLLFSLSSIFIACMISIPLGTYAASRENKLFDKISSGILFTFYSFPVFWVATMLLLLFANPSCLQLFPASGIMPVTGYPPGASIFTKAAITIPYMILPVFCYIYGALAYLSRSMRITVLDELHQDYIKTARAKGLPERSVLIHAFKNSRIPFITIIANVFPSAIAGSIIIETIFTIPGMGFEAVMAVQHQNYPVLVAIFTLSGLLTLSGYWLSDFFYGLADPRISFKTVIK